MSTIFNIALNSIIYNYTKKRRVNKKQDILQRYLKKRRNYWYVLKAKIGNKRKISKIENYFDVINTYHDDIFYMHFRMSRHTFKKLVSSFNTNGILPQTKLPLEKAMLTTLWKLANQSSYRQIADRFNLSRGYAYKVVMLTCKLICKNISYFVKWPEEEMNKIMEKFDVLRGGKSFPNVVGCVDSTHIAIMAPKEHGTDYYNRKGFHSMILQGICDSDNIFLDAYFGWPGRSHDAYVWENSLIGRALKEKTICLPNDSHLIGDSAYKLLPYLMINYRDNGFLTQQQKQYNKILNSSRVCIEQTFGMLKSKFRILKYVETKNINHIKYVVMACVGLYNFIMKNENSVNPTSDYECYNLYDDEVTSYGETELNISEESKLKRDGICLLLSS